MRALSRPTTPRCISSCSPRCRRPGATTSSPRNGARCGWCAASSPARWRSSAPASASAPRSRPTRSCTCPIPELFEALIGVDLAEICITSARDAGERRRPGRRFPAAGGAGRRRRCQPRRGPQMRALLEDLARGRQPIRNIPTSRRATPRRCANGTPCARPRSERLAMADASRCRAISGGRSRRFGSDRRG